MKLWLLARQIPEPRSRTRRASSTDLKLVNIKITSDGVVKVLDFGLAHGGTGDVGTTDLTQSPT